MVQEVKVRERNNQSQRRNQKDAGRKHAPHCSKQPVADEERGVHRKRSKNLSQTHAVQELLPCEQFALLDELPFHQRNYRHPAPESDAANLEEGREKAKQGNVFAVRSGGRGGWRPTHLVAACSRAASMFRHALSSSLRARSLKGEGNAPGACARHRAIVSRRRSTNS